MTDVGDVETLAREDPEGRNCPIAVLRDGVVDTEMVSSESFISRRLGGIDALLCPLPFSSGCFGVQH